MEEIVPVMKLYKTNLKDDAMNNKQGELKCYPNINYVLSATVKE